MTSVHTAARYAALAGLFAAAGCGGGGDRAPADAGPAPQTQTQTQTVTTARTTTANGESGSETQAATHAPDARVLVYFLREGKVAAASRRVAGPAAARAALEALVAGPTAAEREAGFESDVPATIRVGGLTIDGGQARLDASGGDACEGWTQVVYTLTQFPSVSAVESDCTAAPADRSTYEDATPPILLETPAFGEDVRAPARLSGTANTFEATMWVELVDWDGRIVAEQMVTATSGSGDRGTFDVTIPFEVDRPGGAVIVFERSAEDGSRVHLIETPVRLLPR